MVVFSCGDYGQVKIRLFVVKETIKARPKYKQLKIIEALRKIFEYLQVGIMQKLSGLFCWLIFLNERVDLGLEFFQVGRLDVSFCLINYRLRDYGTDRMSFVLDWLT